MLFGTGQTILFVGDSITDAGRRAAAAPYGNGYVGLVRSLRFRCSGVGTLDPQDGHRGAEEEGGAARR